MVSQSVGDIIMTTPMSEIPTIRDLRYVSLALYLSKLSEYFHRILSCGPLVSILLVIYVVATTTYSATTLHPYSSDFDCSRP